MVNGRPVKASYKVRVGDRSASGCPSCPTTTPVPEDIPIDVVYEDEALTVVNKPPGMVTHPAKGNWTGTLVNALQFHYDTLSTLAGENRPGDRPPPRPRHHRPPGRRQGRPGPPPARACSSSCGGSTRNTSRSSTASPSATATTSRRPIGFHPTTARRWRSARPRTAARTAVTFYEVVERFRGYALVRCKPRTGRTHQIRVHLTHIGHPIVADKAYSGRDRLTLGDLLEPIRPPSRSGQLDPTPCSSTARRCTPIPLRFTHPLTGPELDLTAPLPADMARTLEALRNHRAIPANPR